MASSSGSGPPAGHPQQLEQLHAARPGSKPTAARPAWRTHADTSDGVQSASPTCIQQARLRRPMAAAAAAPAAAVARGDQRGREAAHGAWPLDSSSSYHDDIGGQTKHKAQQWAPPSVLHGPGQLHPADLAMAGQRSPFTACFKGQRPQVQLDAGGFPELQLSSAATYEEAVAEADAEEEEEVTAQLLELLQHPEQVRDQQLMPLLGRCEGGRAVLGLMHTQPRYALAPSDNSAPSSTRMDDPEQQQQQQVGEAAANMEAGACVTVSRSCAHADGSQQPIYPCKQQQQQQQQVEEGRRQEAENSRGSAAAVEPGVDGLLAYGLLGPWDSGQLQQLRHILGTGSEPLGSDVPADNGQPPPPPPTAAAAAGAPPTDDDITFQSFQQDVDRQLQMLVEDGRAWEGLGNTMPLGGLFTAPSAHAQQTGGISRISTISHGTAATPLSYSSASMWLPSQLGMQASWPPAGWPGPLQANWGAAAAAVTPLQANQGAAGGVPQVLQANQLAVGGGMPAQGQLYGGAPHTCSVVGMGDHTGVTVGGSDWPAAWLAAAGLWPPATLAAPMNVPVAAPAAAGMTPAASTAPTAAPAPAALKLLNTPPCSRSTQASPCLVHNPHCASSPGGPGSSLASSSDTPPAAADGAQAQLAAGAAQAQPLGHPAAPAQGAGCKQTFAVPAAAPLVPTGLSDRGKVTAGPEEVPAAAAAVVVAPQALPAGVEGGAPPAAPAAKPRAKAAAKPAAQQLAEPSWPCPGTGSLPTPFTYFSEWMVQLAAVGDDLIAYKTIRKAVLVRWALLPTHARDSCNKAGYMMTISGVPAPQMPRLPDMKFSKKFEVKETHRTTYTRRVWKLRVLVAGLWAAVEAAAPEQEVVRLPLTGATFEVLLEMTWEAYKPVPPGQLGQLHAWAPDWGLDRDVAGHTELGGRIPYFLFDLIKEPAQLRQLVTSEADGATWLKVAYGKLVEVPYYGAYLEMGEGQGELLLDLKALFKVVGGWSLGAYNATLAPRRPRQVAN